MEVVVATFLGLVFGSIATLVSGYLQSTAEKERLLVTLGAERDRAKEERLFAARREAYITALAFFSECTIRRVSGNSIHTSIEDVQRSAPIISAITLLAGPQLSEKCAQLSGMFQNKTTDIRPEISLQQEIIVLMKQDLGV